MGENICKSDIWQAIDNQYIKKIYNSTKNDTIKKLQPISNKHIVKILSYHLMITHYIQC